MDNNILKKLDQILKTIQFKLEENIDYFKNINIEYSSKGSSSNAVVYADGEELIFEYKRNKKKIDIAELSNTISNLAKDFESCTVAYNERGQTIIIGTERNNVKVKYIDKAADASNIHCDVSSRSNRDYLIKAGEADEVLKEIGIMTADGKIKNDMIRKYNQIDHFIELISGLLEQLGEKERLTVLDCACGKSYLSFVLNYFIKEKMRKPCHFIGLDISEQVINSSRKMAQNLGYKNMEFHNIDIQNYNPDKKIDLAISLHGCDTATDMAIAAGVKFGAEAIIVVPCCQREILSQYSYEPFREIIKHGILKAKMADVLTDGIRAVILESMGYETSVVEYISPLDTPKNIMIRAIKKGGKNRVAYQEYLKLKEALNIEPKLGKLLNI